MNGWENEFQLKITLDARSITKRSSQTEVMMQIYERESPWHEFLNSDCLDHIFLFFFDAGGIESLSRINS